METRGVELVIAPPFTALDAARDPGGRWSLAAQNVAAETEGAYTGEVSARMLADAGCRYVIVGHSERRRLFGEDGRVLARKLARVREAGLDADLLRRRDGGGARGRPDRGDPRPRRSRRWTDDPSDAPLVVAYEPVWAIGTGQAATAADAGSAARPSRGAALRAPERSHPLRRLRHRRKRPELLEAASVDGFLIGGASLEAARSRDRRDREHCEEFGLGLTDCVDRPGPAT